MKFVLSTIIFVMSVLPTSAQLTVFQDPPSEIASVEQSDSKVEEAKKPDSPTAYLYTTSGCVPCKIAKRDITQKYPWINLEERFPPEWVNAYPTLHFKTASGKWHKIVGWGPAHEKIFIRYMNELRSDNEASLIPAEAQPTPHREVHRLLKELDIDEDETFVDPGCGDARACIIASSVYGCNSVGIEINKERADQARKRVNELGLGDKVTIIHGDATKLNWKGDVGFVYLYPELLEELKPKLESLDRVVSYQHPIPGMRMRKTGSSYIWNRYDQRQSSQYAVWGGKKYTGRVCTSPNCRMCNSIQRQLRK